jgi:hypothetical protein
VAQQEVKCLRDGCKLGASISATRKAADASSAVATCSDLRRLGGLTVLSSYFSQSVLVQFPEARIVSRHNSEYKPNDPSYGGAQSRWIFDFVLPMPNRGVLLISGEGHV